MSGGTDFEIVFAGGVTGPYGVSVVGDVREVGEYFPDGFFRSVRRLRSPLRMRAWDLCPSAMLFTNR